jgi:hypothetical protein
VEHKCIRLPLQQVQWLEQEAKTRGISEGEIVRRALDEFRDRNKREREGGEKR